MMSDTAISRIVPVVFVLCCGIGWYYASVFHLVSPLLLPPFHQTMADLWNLIHTGAFWPDLLITLYELLMAFLIAAISGVLIGYFIARNRFTIQVFDPFFSALYSVPTILLFPLFVLFFGLGSGSKIAMGATIAFFPVVLTTIAGLGNVEPAFVKSARSMGASNWQMFFQVLLPASLPVVLSGLRMGVILALLTILGSETLGSLAGLGHQIVNYSDAMETSKMFAYTLFVLGVATGLNILVSSIERVARRAVQ